jgi:hypothetical protein
MTGLYGESGPSGIRKDTPCNFSAIFITSANIFIIFIPYVDLLWYGFITRNNFRIIPMLKLGNREERTASAGIVKKNQ